MAIGKTLWDTAKGIWNYAPKAINPQWAKNAGYATNKTLVRNLGKAGTRGLKGGAAAAVGLGSLLGDNGPDDDETMQRAMNQLRYGADMTDEQLEEAQAEGKEFRDTGIIGENGLNEEQVRAYIAQNADQRGAAERIGGGALNVLTMIPGAGQLLGLTGGMEYDRRLGKARNLNLENIVGKLKADANEGNIRRNMEGTMGKFMAEGLLDKEFGRGNVRTQGGIKPPVDRAAQAEEAAALKEYESIRDRDGVFAALAHPSALKAGRQVYLDVQEASGGDKDVAESLLSGVGGQEGVGLTDQETMEKTYGNREKNALQNRVTSVEAQLATAAKESAERQAAAEQAQKELVKKEEKVGPVDLRPAQNAEQVRQNREAIVASNGYHGESPQAEMQRAYLEDRGVPTERGMNQRLEAAADYAYQKQYGVARNSPEATAQLLYRHALKVQQGQKAYQDNRAKMADIEYAKHIVKPGDPDYKLGPQVTASTPDEMAQADRDSAASMGDGSVPTAPAPLPAQVRASAQVQTAPAPSRAALLGPRATVPPTAAPTTMSPTPNGIGTSNRGTGLPQVPDIGAPVRNAVDRALTRQSSRPANVMAPTPYGLGTATPSMPQLPDIGAPVRNAVDRALTQQTSRPSNVMAPTPYGLGAGTAGVPQAPDIGAPVRNAVEGALTQKSSPPGVVPKKPMTQAEIAMMLAEDKRKEIEARNRANPPKSPIPRPNPMGRFIR